MKANLDPGSAVFIPFGFPARAGGVSRLGWILDARERFCGMALFCRIHSAWEMPGRLFPHAPFVLDPFMPHLPRHGIKLLAHVSAIARAGTPAEHLELLSRCLAPARAYERAMRAAYSRQDGWHNPARRAVLALRAALRTALGPDMRGVAGTLRVISCLPDCGESRGAGIIVFRKPMPGGCLSSVLRTSKDQFLAFCDFRFFGRVIALSLSDTCYEADLLASYCDGIYSEHLDPNADGWQPHAAWSMAQILIARWAGRMARFIERDRFAIVLE